MATIKIGGRELDVAPDTLGFRKHKMLPWALEHDRIVKLEEGQAKADALNASAAKMLLLFVGHNEGCDLAWAESIMPADAGPLMLAVRQAANKAAQVAALGEAAAP